MSFLKFIDDCLSGIELAERVITGLEQHGAKQICSACRVLPALHDGQLCKLCNGLSEESAISVDGTVINADFVVKTLDALVPKDAAEREVIARLVARFGAIADARKRGGRED